MIYHANWADEIKSDNIYPESIKDGWHFQDFNAGLSDSLIADALVHYPAEGGNLFRVLDSLEVEMTGEQVTRANAIHIMRFLVHLNGDQADSALRGHAHHPHRQVQDSFEGC